jgi:hypothetical protein
MSATVLSIIASNIFAVAHQPKRLRGKRFRRKSDSSQTQKERAIAMAYGSTFEYEDSYDDELEM